MVGSPLGDVVLRGDGELLCSLDFDPPIGTEACRSAEVFRQAKSWLEDYFSGRVPGFLPPLAPQGTPFQMRVWSELLTIPFGSIITYGELARRVGCRSAQAVGQAVARNPIAVIIPCHRVVACRGLGGYAYGEERKRRLIQWERRHHAEGGGDGYGQ